MNDLSDDKRKRKRRPKPGDIAALRRILWETTLEVEKVLRDADLDRKLKAASTIATLGGVYLRAIETADLELRIAELEKRTEGETT